VGKNKDWRHPAWEDVEGESERLLDSARANEQDSENSKGERTDDPQTMRSGRTGHRTLKPAQGLERGRDGGEVKVMTVIRAWPIVE
jgi:hypothetical protein